MALSTSITTALSIGGTNIDVTDTTGDYNITTNPTGYGVDRNAGALGANAANDTFTQVAHGLAQNEIIHFSDVGSLTGLNLDQAYYVIYLNNDNFSLAASLNGSAIDFGGTIGTADYNIGYRKADEVDRTYFEVTAYAPGIQTNANPLASAPFIPNGATTDTTTLTAANVDGGAAGAVITDGVYDVVMVPTWSPNASITDSGTSTYTVTGVDFSNLYAGYDKLYVIDGATTYRFNISSIEFVGGNTIITCEEAIHAGTYGNGDYFIGKGASKVIAATYSLHQCYLEQSAEMTKADYQSACNNVSSKQYQIVNQLFFLEQGGLNAVISGDYANAQEIIEMGTKICTRLDSTNCGC